MICANVNCKISTFLFKSGCKIIIIRHNGNHITVGLDPTLWAHPCHFEIAHGYLTAGDPTQGREKAREMGRDSMAGVRGDWNQESGAVGENNPVETQTKLTRLFKAII